MSGKTIFFYSGIGIFLSLLASCSSMYMPNVPAAPMFSSGGDFYASGNINTKGNLSANVGVAVTDHVGVIANGSYVDSKNNNKDYAQKMAEGAIGYFTRFGKNNNRIFEVYAGYGVGTANVVDKRSSTAGQAVVQTRDMDFDKVFVQANFSSEKKDAVRLFGGKRNLNYGTILRLSSLTMKSFEIDGMTAQKENNVLIEPVFFTRMGIGGNWQLQYTNGMVFGLQGNDYLKAGYPIFTLGVLYKFNK